MISAARRCWHPRRVAGVAAATTLMALGGGIAFGTPAGAAPVTVNVTNNHDSGAGSLRAALVGATGTTIVNVKAGLGTITLSSPIVFPTEDSVLLTLHGNGITINANGKTSALVSNSSSFSFDGFTVTGVGGSANTDAGGIVAFDGSLAVSNCNLHGNAIHASGHDAGAILSEGGPLSVSSCTFTGNTLRTDGNRGDAGVILAEGNTLRASGCTVSSNTIAGTGDAAAILSEGAELTVASCTFTGNTVQPNGHGGDAGVIVSEGRTLSASGCTLTSNKTTAAGDGATILSEGGQLLVSTCKVSANVVTAGGDVAGGADSEGSATTFRNVTDTCNSATSNGGDAAGGLLQEGGVPTISGSTIVGNTAKSSGDAAVEQQINSRGSAPVISGSTVSDNTSICHAPATTTTTTTTVPVTAASVAPTTVAATAELPRTGGHSSQLGLVGLALVTLGTACTYAASSKRRRRTSR